MNQTEKLKILEDLMELEENSLNSQVLLDELEEWDSMNALSFILMIEERFEKLITTDHILECSKIEDLLKIMEE